MKKIVSAECIAGRFIEKDKENTKDYLRTCIGISLLKTKGDEKSID